MDNWSLHDIECNRFILHFKTQIMQNSHDVHLQEREYIKRVNNHLVHHYGKSLDELAIDRAEVAKGLHDHKYPAEFVDSKANEWGIKRLTTYIAGTAHRIIAHN